MGKKEKRTKRRLGRSERIFDKASGSVTVICSKCKNKVQIGTIEQWAICELCKSVVRGVK